MFFSLIIMRLSAIQIMKKFHQMLTPSSCGLFHMVFYRNTHADTSTPPKTNCVKAEGTASRVTLRSVMGYRLSLALMDITNYLPDKHLCSFVL